MSFSIRRAEEKDVPALHSLWMEIMNHHAGQGPMFDYDSKYDDELKKSLGERIVGDNQRGYVAIENNEVIGCLMCRINVIPPFIAIKKTGYIAETVVSKAARSKGIGTKLVKTAQAWFDAQNCQAAELQVSVKNEAGIRFWERLGFTPSTYHMHRVSIK